MFCFYILKYLKDFVVLGMEFGAVAMLGICPFIEPHPEVGEGLGKLLHSGW